MTQPQLPFGTPCPPPVISYQKLGGAASRAHGGAVQVEDWGGCPEGRGSELSEGQQSGGQPGDELGLLNLKKKKKDTGPDAAGVWLWLMRTGSITWLQSPA